MSHLPESPNRSEKTGSARSSFTPFAGFKAGQVSVLVGNVALDGVLILPQHPSIAFNAARRGR